MLGRTYDGQDCGLARALEVVGERWTLLIVRDALHGVERFSDFATRLDIPRAVLADRLRSLVELGVLERLPDPEHGGRSLYRLTADGRALWPALHALMRWGAARSGAAVRVHRHVTCGSDLRPGGVCPECGVVAPLEEVETERPGPPASGEDRVTAALRGRRRMLEPLRLAKG